MSGKAEVLRGIEHFLSFVPNGANVSIRMNVTPKAVLERCRSSSKSKKSEEPKRDTSTITRKLGKLRLNEDSATSKRSSSRKSVISSESKKQTCDSSSAYSTSMRTENIFPPAKHIRLIGKKTKCGDK